jgi:hypothetical protein
MLIMTMDTTMTKLVTSPVAADKPLATRRMITSGYWNDELLKG